ncbi:MAG: succinate dehydrogenase, cytochrome b556 subunit [Candidatus Hydrogenedentota bacterium]
MFKRYKNYLGIAGWGVGRRWGIERYLYILHRITGLGILSYFLLHIFVTTSRIFGEEVWEFMMRSVDKPIFKIGEFMVFLAFCFHGLNGLRLIFIELGFKLAIGEAEEPVYPYKTSLNKQRPLLFVCMVICIVLVILGGINFIRVFHF